jgi:hypothetical protein
MIVESYDDVIHLSGDLVSNQWEAIRTAAGLVLKRHPEGVVVDCGGLRTATPEGVQTFFDMMMHIQSKDARIIVANLPPAVKSAIQGVEEVRSGLAIAESVDDARQSLELMNRKANGGTKQKHHTTGALVLAVDGGSSDGEAIALAAAVAERRQLEIILLFPLIVPLSLPTGTVMAEEEDEAVAALDRAKSMLEKKCPAVQPHVERTRSVAAAVAKLAEETSARAVVVALPEADPSAGEPAKTMDAILSKVRSEVIFVRGGSRAGH